MKLDGEVWKNLPGNHQRCIIVSETGRVRIERLHIKGVFGKDLKPSKGWVAITHKGTERVSINIPKTVFELFCELPEGYGEKWGIFFKDGDSDNLSYQNLFAMPWMRQGFREYRMVKEIAQAKCTVCGEFKPMNQFRTSYWGAPSARCTTCPDKRSDVRKVNYRTRPEGSWRETKEIGGRTHYHCEGCGRYRLPRHFYKQSAKTRLDGLSRFCKECVSKDATIRKEEYGPIPRAEIRKKMKQYSRANKPWRKSEKTKEDVMARRRKQKEWREETKQCVMTELNSETDRYSQSEKPVVTELMGETIERYFPDGSIGFLSMPHHGREILQLSKQIGINPVRSIAVERHYRTYQAFKEISGELFPGMKKVVADINEYITDGRLDKELEKSKTVDLEVAHLDYNGPLTDRSLQALDKCLQLGLLSFVTFMENGRWSNSSYVREFKTNGGEIVMDITYAGLNSTTMRTVGVLPRNLRVSRWRKGLVDFKEAVVDRDPNEAPYVVLAGPNHRESGNLHIVRWWHVQKMRFKNRREIPAHERSLLLDMGFTEDGGYIWPGRRAVAVGE